MKEKIQKQQLRITAERGIPLSFVPSIHGQRRSLIYSWIEPLPTHHLVTNKRAQDHCRQNYSYCKISKVISGGIPLWCRVNYENTFIFCGDSDTWGAELEGLEGDHARREALFLKPSRTRLRKDTLQHLKEWCCNDWIVKTIDWFEAGTYETAVIHQWTKKVGILW